MNPALLNLLLQIAGMYVAQAAQHSADQNHPQTAFNLGVLGTILAAAFPMQPVVPVIPVVPVAPVVPTPVTAAPVVMQPVAPVVPFPPGRA